MINAARAADRPYPRAAVDTLLGWAEGLDKNSEDARGVRQTLLTAMALWEVPRISAATAASDFDLRQLRERRMSIFLCAQPSDLHRMRPVFAIFFQQLIDAMAREEYGDKPEHRHRVLAILDEFWSLGEHRVLAEASAFIRSSGLRMAIVVQSKDQTRLSFGEDGSRNLYANMGVEIALGGLDLNQAQEISARSGTDTVQTVTTQRPKFMAWLHQAKQSESQAERPRPLLLPQEVQQLPPHQLLVLRRRLRLLRLDRVVWHQDAHFQYLADEPPEIPTLPCDIERDPAPAGPSLEAVAAAAREKEQTAAQEAQDKADADAAEFRRVVAQAQDLAQRTADAERTTAEAARQTAARAAVAAEQARVARADAADANRTARGESATAADLERAADANAKVERLAAEAADRAETARGAKSAATAAAQAARSAAKRAEALSRAAEANGRSLQQEEPLA
jgi:type IV secretion system protein VirD4